MQEIRGYAVLRFIMIVIYARISTATKMCARARETSYLIFNNKEYYLKDALSPSRLK